MVDPDKQDLVRKHMGADFDDSEDNWDRHDIKLRLVVWCASFAAIGYLAGLFTPI